MVSNNGGRGRGRPGVRVLFCLLCSCTGGFCSRAESPSSFSSSLTRRGGTETERSKSPGVTRSSPSTWCCRFRAPGCSCFFFRVTLPRSRSSLSTPLAQGRPLLAAGVLPPLPVVRHGQQVEHASSLPAASRKAAGEQPFSRRYMWSENGSCCWSRSADRRRLLPDGDGEGPPSMGRGRDGRRRRFA
jgi:hypothetical protein